MAQKIYSKLSRPELIEQLFDLLQTTKTSNLAEDEIQLLFHELQVHQIELELQSRALQDTQQDLEVSRDRYAELYDFAPVGLLTLNEKGCILDINLAGAALLGQERARVVDRPLSIWLEPAYSRHFFNHLVQVFRSRGKVVVELTFKGSKQLQRKMRLESVAIIDQNGFRACRTALFDISEQRAIETTLQQSEECFRQFAEQLQEVIWIYDLDQQRVLYVNPAYEKILGRSSLALYQYPNDWLKAVYLEDQERVRQIHARKISTGKFDTVYRIVRSDGEPRWIRERGFPIRNGAGEIYRIAGIAEDITESKQLQEHMEHIKRQQMELIQRERLTLVAEIASKCVHELEQPLTAISDCADKYQKVLNDLGPMAPEGLKEPIATIFDQARQIEAFTRKLRQFMGKPEPLLEPVNINDLIAELTPLIDKEAQQHRVLSRFLLAEQLPTISVDRLQIKQVILNLMSNAMEAMEAAEPEMRLLTLYTAQINPSAIEVAIADTGSGLSEAARQSLFQPFFTTKPDAMGLSVAISQSIIQAHGGRLWAESNPDGGMIFRFTLPIIS